MDEIRINTNECDSRTHVQNGKFCLTIVSDNGTYVVEMNAHYMRRLAEILIREAPLIERLEENKAKRGE